MRTPSNHPDLRVIKTKKAIRRAFTELLTEKDIDSITIKDIAERAIINRKTIYNYYRGVYQIVEDIENGIAADLDTAVRELEQRRDAGDPCLIFRIITGMIEENIEFYGALLLMNPSSGFAARIRQMLCERVRQVFARSSEMTPETLNATVDFAVSGVISVYRSSLRREDGLGRGKLSDIVERMCRSGFSVFIGDGQA